LSVQIKQTTTIGGCGTLGRFQLGRVATEEHEKAAYTHRVQLVTMEAGPHPGTVHHQNCRRLLYIYYFCCVMDKKCFED